MGGNHWVGVAGSVSVGATVLRVGVAEGVSATAAVGVGVGTRASGFMTSSSMPMQ